MTGCGSKGESVEATEAVENTESTEEVPAVPLAQYDLKGSDYVTLCDYSAIPVTISGDYDVTDQDVLDYVEKIFTQGGPFYTAGVYCWNTVPGYDEDLFIRLIRTRQQWKRATL